MVQHILKRRASTANATVITTVRVMLVTSVLSVETMFVMLTLAMFQLRIALLTAAMKWFTVISVINH